MNPSMVNDDPRAPYKVYGARNAEAHTRRAPKHGEHNSDLPRPSRNVTSLSGTFWVLSFHDWLPPGAPNPPRSAG